MMTAGDLSGKIDEFLDLASQLDLTLAEENALTALPPGEWGSWRKRAIAATTPAPPLLVRRLDYALALLRRMAASAATLEPPRKAR